MNPADFSSLPELSNHLLQEDFSAIVQCSGFGELMTDLGICDHEQFSGLNPNFGDQSDDRSGFDGAVSQSAGFDDRQMKRGSGSESAFAHALKSSTMNSSSEDPAHAHGDGDEENLSWNKSKRRCAESSDRTASGTGGVYIQKLQASTNDSLLPCQVPVLAGQSQALGTQITPGISIPRAVLVFGDPRPLPSARFHSARPC